MNPTTEGVSTHRLVIRTIHDNWFTGDHFALRDIVRAAGVSTSSVVRALRLLKEANMVAYSIRAYAGRHYRVTPQWPHTAADAIRTFEYMKIIQL